MSSRFLRWVVLGEDTGNKLLRYIHKQFEGRHSLKSLKRALDGNCCSVNERKERFANFSLSAGDRIAFDCALMDPIRQVVFDSKQLLFEDDHFLIYNKPAGMVYDTKGLLTLLQKKFPKVVAVHRLDKETSGAIIYAKSEDVKLKFVQLFKVKNVHKEYLAIVDGQIKKKKGVMTASLGKVREFQGQSIWGELSLEKGGLNAETRWTLLKSNPSCSLVVCEPITGRTHQIRLHFSLSGHPILGDYHYGRCFKCDYPAKRHLLHAWKLTFPHPLSGRKISVTAPLPTDFLEAQASLFQKGSIA